MLHPLQTSIGWVGAGSKLDVFLCAICLVVSCVVVSWWLFVLLSCA